VHFSGTVPTTANNFATAALQSGGSLLLQAITLGTNTITWPAGLAGNYLCQMNILAGTSASALSVSPSAGASGLNLLTSTTRDATSIAYSVAATAGQVATATFTVTVAASGGLVTIGASTIVAGTGMDLFIVSLPSSLLTKPALPPSAEERVQHLESQVQQLMGLLSPPRSASCVTVEEAEEAKLAEVSPPAASSDELGASVHIPRGLLAQFLGGSKKV